MDCRDQMYVELCLARKTLTSSCVVYEWGSFAMQSSKGLIAVQDNWNEGDKNVFTFDMNIRRKFYVWHVLVFWCGYSIIICPPVTKSLKTLIEADAVFKLLLPRVPCTSCLHDHNSLAINHPVSLYVSICVCGKYRFFALWLLILSLMVRVTLVN